MKMLTRAALVLALCATAQADVVRPAPNFGIDGVAKTTSLRSFRGQSVVLLITRSAREKNFRSQVYRLRDLYSQFATEKVIFVAAIQSGPENVPSDIPFVTAANPAQVASDYGVNGRFAVAVIGIDGNLNLITTKVINATRIKDIIFNNYDKQQTARKPINTSG